MSKEINVIVNKKNIQYSTIKEIFEVVSLEARNSSELYYNYTKISDDEYKLSIVNDDNSYKLNNYHLSNSEINEIDKKEKYYKENYKQLSLVYKKTELVPDLLYIRYKDYLVYLILTPTISIDINQYNKLFDFIKIDCKHLYEYIIDEKLEQITVPLKIKMSSRTNITYETELNQFFNNLNDKNDILYQCLYLLYVCRRFYFGEELEKLNMETDSIIISSVFPYFMYKLTSDVNIIDNCIEYVKSQEHAMSTDLDNERFHNHVLRSKYLGNVFMAFDNIVLKTNNFNEHKQNKDLMFLSRISTI